MHIDSCDSNLDKLTTDILVHWKIFYVKDISFKVTITKDETKGQLVNVLTFAGNVMYGDSQLCCLGNAAIHNAYINEWA